MIWRLLLLALFALPLAWCGESLGTYNFRITVEVDTPDGVKSGSSVLAVSYSRGPNMHGGQSASAELRGEAVFVDLGHGKSVIALLTHGAKGDDVDEMQWLPVTALTGASMGWGSTDELKKRGGRLEGKAELKPPLIPTLVTFSNLNDPTTARVVYATTVAVTLSPDGSQYRNGGPIVAVDTFASTFGPGYAFKRATLEMVPVGIWPLNLIGITGEPVTQGIEGKVTFLITHRDQLYQQSYSLNGYVAMTGQFTRY